MASWMKKHTNVMDGERGNSEAQLTAHPNKNKSPRNTSDLPENVIY